MAEWLLSVSPQADMSYVLEGDTLPFLLLSDKSLSSFWFWTRSQPPPKLVSARGTQFADWPGLWSQPVAGARGPGVG